MMGLGIEYNTSCSAAQRACVSCQNGRTRSHRELRQGPRNNGCFDLLTLNPGRPVHLIRPPEPDGGHFDRPFLFLTAESLTSGSCGI